MNRNLYTAGLFLLVNVWFSSADVITIAATATDDDAEVHSDERALDPATAKTLTVEDARRVVASAGELLSLPHLSQLSADAAHELATTRYPSNTCIYKVCVPAAREKTATYTAMEHYTEEKTREDGTKVTVTKCRPVTRTKTYTVTICVTEERSHVCPLTLVLDGLTSPTTEVLAELAKHDGNLHLSGLKALSRDEARLLAAHKGGSLVLNGIGSMDADVAEALASHIGDVSLNGIRALFASTAKALCKSKHGVSLNGLTVLTDEIAAELATHEGSASLQGVKQASKKAIQVLRGRPVALPQELLSEQKKEKE